ncbi:MAG: diguanylate cyclase [Stagnimonas sp.]|nr:diguanylate cyclase [Stagnimonas sp.]
MGLRLALVAALPMLVLVLVLQLLHNRGLQGGFAEELRQLARGSAAQIDLYLEQHLAALGSLAALAVEIDPAGPAAGAGLTRLLERGHPQHPGFISLLVAAADGSVVAASMSGRPVPPDLLNADGTVSDRSYFQVPMLRDRAYVSGVFRGRGFGEDPIVALSVPLHGPSGQPRGVVEGSLDLSRLGRFDPLQAGAELAMVVLDPEARVIYASAQSGQSTLTSLADMPALGRVRSAAPGEAVRYQPARGESGPGYLLVRWPLQAGWEVVAWRQTRVLGALERQAAGLTLVLLLTALALTGFIARRLAAQVAAPILRLAREVAAFDAGAEPPAPPRSAPREVQELFAGYGALSQRLRQTLREQGAALSESDQLRLRLQDNLSERERQVETRTRELNERSRALQIANAELAIANSELERLTGEDALTGVANRRAFEDFLAGSWRLAQRQGQPLALIMLDIDHFKRYNDHLGHPAGDDCLRRVAKAARQCLRRPADLFARYGGEEFVAVLGHTDLEQALRLAETLREAIHALALPHGAPGAGPQVTASLGVAAVVPGAGTSREQLLAMADAALYQAKRDGRDCVRAAPES